MRDKHKKLRRIKFARETMSKTKFEINTHTTPNGEIWTRVDIIKPRKTVLNRLKRWWVYLTT